MSIVIRNHFDEKKKLYNLLGLAAASGGSMACKPTFREQPLSSSAGNRDGSRNVGFSFIEFSHRETFIFYKK
jgi:hypothetical protein